MSGSSAFELAKSALERAKKSVDGPTGLARAIGGITPQAVWQWEQVPVGRVLDVERVSGVSRHELRPDIYPPADAATAQGSTSPFPEAAQ